MRSDKTRWWSLPARHRERLRLRSVPAQWWRAAVAVLGCALVGAVVGVFAKPPGGNASASEPSVGVVVAPVYQHELVRARVPILDPPELRGALAWRGPEQVYGSTIFSTAANSDTALSLAVGSALDYARALTRHENALMPVQGEPKRIRELQRSLIREPSRFRVGYTPDRGTPEATTSFAPASWRTGLLGALVGALALCSLQLVTLRRPSPALATGSAPAPIWRFPRGIGAFTLAAALTGLLAVLASRSGGAYALVLVALVFALAFAFAEAGGRPAVRALVVTVIVISALRGALLGLSNAISLPDGLTTVNALQPAIIAACALAVLLDRRGRFPRSTRPLLVGWGLIAAVAVLDLATQTVGHTLYAVGLGQYLTYPTLAVVAWLVMERGDSERLVRLLVLIAAAVAVTVFVEAVGLIGFVEAAPTANPTSGHRYGGATGSYLHAGMFLGTAAVLAMGMMLERWRQRAGVVAAVALAMTLGAVGLTLSRGGYVIAGIGALALLAAEGRRDRLRLVATGVVVLLVAVGIGTAGGVTPGELTSRVGSGFNTSSDPGNEGRLTAWRRSVQHFEHLPASEKVLGEGLAATGNARALTSLQVITTESYPLKLLIEVGLVGTLIIGAYLVWGAARFARTSIRGPDRLVRAAGAAGLGLSVYGLAYPTLQAQLLAMAWWMLLVACLGANRAPPAED
jgi:hypothetical protein